MIKIMTRSIFKKLEGMQELSESVYDKKSLLSKLKKELSAYNVFDLMKVQALLENDCRYLPPNYKKKVKEKMCEQIFSNYKIILSNDNCQNQELDMEQYNDFLKIFLQKLDDITASDTREMTVLYFLCAMYNLFITRTPPHPVGTPFPGGFCVEKKGDEYYCPVKDKQTENEEAICKFCIAKQDDRVK
jgi:uncharacterized protein (UPF0305 family)